jgi:hypothetical protein
MQRPLSIPTLFNAVLYLDRVLRLTHYGYRCPDMDCPGHPSMHRSAQADALALPGFTFDLDVLLLAGTLRLGEHRTLDEVHWALLDRLGTLGVSISRREVAYLIETYTALLRAGSEVTSDESWLERIREQGGMLLSLDGIQPDKGNETVYLVREVRTGRMLLAEPTRDSETETSVPSSCPNSSDSRGSARHSQRCANLPALRHCHAVAHGAAPGVPVPCVARCIQSHL